MAAAMSSDVALATPSSSALQSSPLGMFRHRSRLFIELHEFRGAAWRETRRWNYGLEQELQSSAGSAGGGSGGAEAEERRGRSPRPAAGAAPGPSWKSPHLPSSSLLGAVALRDALAPELVLLDVPEETLEPIASLLLDRLEGAGWLAPASREHALGNMVQRLQRRDSAVVARYRSGRLRPLAAGSGPGTVGGEPEPGLLEPDDPLRPDVDEETVHVLIDDTDWLERDVVCFVRFRAPIDTGLEEGASSNLRSKARFIVLVLGPCSEVEPQRHIEMGEAAAALLQHDAVVRAAYEAQQPVEFLASLERCFREVRLVPQTTHPTLRGVRHRAERMLRQTLEIKRKKSLLRTQKWRWQRRQKLRLARGLSVGGVLSKVQRLSLPLLSGIVLGLVLANLDWESYDHWTGYGPDREGGHHVERPTLFGLEIGHHSLTLHFVVNDILMCLFFGLAMKEIVEAFQPGGSLYPPARSTVNVVAATLGGVLGPVAVYFLLLGTLFSAGALDSAYTFGEYSVGWGVPTATDIAVGWMTALCVFGRGHPAINFLLLLAIIDDGIGLLIIAVAYPDPEMPVRPVWLLLVLAGMLVALGLRLLRCGRWQLYVLLAGPLAWLGLLFSALHPSLALVVVVPFMPLDTEADARELHRQLGDEGEEVVAAVAAVAAVADARPEGDGHARGRGRGCGSRAPLHDFEEATKPFVDFVVLFAFGAVNAGVRVKSFGALTVVVLASLVVGKTLGILGASTLAECLGCPPPGGMTHGVVASVGLIASAGLTVALFIAGEAFEQHPLLMAQAKLAALLSVAAALAAIAGSALRACCLPGPRVARAPKAEAGAGGAAEEEEKEEEEEHDLSLEDTVVRNTVRSLQLLHQAERAVERTQANWHFMRC